MAVLHGVKLMGLDYTFIVYKSRRNVLSGIQALPMGARSPVKSGVSFCTSRCPDTPINFPKGITLFLQVSFRLDLTTQNVISGNFSECVILSSRHLKSWV